MIIHDGFYISGFSRIDMGEAGAVFVRYEVPKADDRKPEIKETPLYYGGKNTANYTVSIPMPKARNIEACAIVTRSSKNCYTATVFDARGKTQRIETFREASIESLRKCVAQFFKG